MIHTEWFLLSLATVLGLVAGIRFWREKSLLWPCMLAFIFSLCTGVFYAIFYEQLHTSWTTEIGRGLVITLISLWTCVVANYAWKVWKTPWLFSWSTLGSLLSIQVIIYGTIEWCYPIENGLYSNLWIDFLKMQLGSPIYIVFAWICWVGVHYKCTLNASKDIKPEQAYAVLRIHHLLARTDFNEEAWLKYTAKYVQFMKSNWWQAQGLRNWPDMMEWHAKMGSEGMLWFLQERIKNPPDLVEDYSSSGAVW